MIIDTHVHLDDGRYEEDFDQMLSRADENGVGAFVIPGADPSSLGRAVQLSEKYANIYFAVGVHPYDMPSFNALDFEKYLSHPKCIAVGECGLDYYRLEGSDEEKALEKRRQQEIFRQQIRIAKAHKKPLIVHIRDASADSKTILLEEGAGEVGGVLHCYNADEQLLALADENFYFGIGGVLTFANARRLVEILPRIPLQKLLIETDGPYLTPHPHRGKRNEPSYTVFIAEKIARLLNMPAAQIRKITTENAKRLFGI